MASQFTGSFDVLGSINTIAVEGAPPNTLGSSELSGSLGVTGSLDLAYLSGSTTTEPGAWSAGGALITARWYLAGAGTQNAGLAFGGATPAVSSLTEEYTGGSTTYTTAPTINYDATNGALVLSQVLATSYADDTAAAAGGVPLEGLYRNGNFVQIRLV